MRRTLRDPVRRRWRPLLDRVLQLGPQPFNLRVLQSGLQRRLQEHADVRSALLLQLLEGHRHGSVRVVMTDLRSVAKDW